METNFQSKLIFRNNLPKTNASGQVASIPHENQQGSGDSLTRTRSQIHSSITEFSTKKSNPFYEKKNPW